MAKVSKLIKAASRIVNQPSLLNLVLDENIVRAKEHYKQYPNLLTLPQVSLNSFGDFDGNVELFILDGGSLPTDIALLKTLAKGKQSYFEIGTWRGESVWNVAKNIQDCTTLNLSKEEMLAFGWDPKYADLHGILSKKNSNINHIEGNTKTFNFAGLNKKYDLIFIDGDHSYDMVKHDTSKVFENLLHEDTIVVWHDYAFNPEKVRYEVFNAILDAIPSNLHQHLYHVQNTMCAVFMKGEFKTMPFESPKKPTTIFDIQLKSESF